MPKSGNYVYIPPDFGNSLLSAVGYLRRTILRNPTLSDWVFNPNAKYIIEIQSKSATT
jgi:hypothetical protein